VLIKHCPKVWSSAEYLKERMNLEWSCTPLIPALGRHGQENENFEASLDYIWRSKPEGSSQQHLVSKNRLWIQ
jgi:hypothetical protein